MQAVRSPVVRRAPALQQCARCSILLMADHSDVRWLDPIDPNQGDMEPSSETATVMPIFPLGVTYLPYTTTVLNFFEPRYRQMFNDILMNGARRFAVVNIDAETGRFAEVGVIFYLDELKEVSEQTDDRVKYIGTHSVKGRVEIKKVLNLPCFTSQGEGVARISRLRDSP